MSTHPWQLQGSDSPKQALLLDVGEVYPSDYRAYLPTLYF